MALIGSALESVLRDDQDLQRKILAIWDKYKRATEIMRINFIGKLLDCDNQDEADRMTKEFVKTTSNLLADSVREMKLCMARRMTAHVTNDYIRRVMNNNSRNSSSDESAEDE